MYLKQDRSVINRDEPIENEPSKYFLISILTMF